MELLNKFQIQQEIHKSRVGMNWIVSLSKQAVKHCLVFLERLLTLQPMDIIYMKMDTEKSQ